MTPTLFLLAGIGVGVITGVGIGVGTAVGLGVGIGVGDDEGVAIGVELSGLGLPPFETGTNTWPSTSYV